MGLVVFVIVVVAIVAGISWIQSENTNRAWEEAARKLRLRYVGGGWLIDRSMAGHVDDVRVRVYEFSRRSGKSKKQFTGYQARGTFDFPRGMELSKQGLFSGVAKFFGSEDIEIQDRVFDQSVVIKGGQPKAIGAYLTRPRKQRILTLMHHFDDCEITEGLLFAAKRGREQIASDLEGRLREVIEAVKVLEDKGERSVEDKTVRLPEVRLQVPTPEPEAMESTVSTDAQSTEVAPPEAPESTNLSTTPTTTALDQVTPPSPPPPREDIDFAALAEAIFETPSSRFEATRLFESTFAGKPIHWTGRLVRLTEYTYDLVFKSGPGLIAHFEMQTFERHPYGIRVVTAAVQLPAEPELRDRLDASLNQPFTFHGRLKKCDAFYGTLFVKEGRIEE